MAWRPWLECAAIAAAYVLPLHRGKRRGRDALRDSPATIWFRAAATLAACCVAWLPTWRALYAHTQDAGEAWRRLPATLGLTWQGSLRAALAPLALTAALFLGPLALKAADFWDLRQQQSDRSGEDDDRERRRPAVWPRALRDYVLAPLTEEFTFRACMAPLLLLGGTSVKRTVALAPLYFAAAHLHHFYELVVLQGRPVAAASQQVLAQFLYTSTFGWYASWLFVRSGHLTAPVAVHALCNALGFPDFERMTAHRAQPLLSAATAAGVVLFGVLLRPLTEPGFYGVDGGILGALPSRL